MVESFARYIVWRDHRCHLLSLCAGFLVVFTSHSSGGKSLHASGYIRMALVSEAVWTLRLLRGAESASGRMYEFFAANVAGAVDGGDFAGFVYCQPAVGWACDVCDEETRRICGGVISCKRAGKDDGGAKGHRKLLAGPVDRTAGVCGVGRVEGTAETTGR